jgi:hypothetical protein
MDLGTSLDRWQLGSIYTHRSGPKINRLELG